MKNRLSFLNSIAQIRIVLITLAVAGVTLCVDQFTKSYIAGHYSPNETILGIPQLSLVFVTNAGGLCGYAQKAGPLLAIVGIITNLIVVFAIFFLMPHKRSYAVAFGFLLAGASGNLIDRLRFGYVIDFITIDILRWPSFNFADASILAGIGLLGFFLLFEMLHDQSSNETPSEKWNLDRGTVLFLIVSGIVFVAAYIICIFHPFG